MYIYNLTIVLDEKEEDKFKSHVREVMPKFVKNFPFDNNYQLLRIINNKEPDTISYSLQFFAKDIKDIQAYAVYQESSFIEELRKPFYDDFVYFSTILEKTILD